jgi:pantetheine-phosphate adenylyltransferase
MNAIFPGTFDPMTIGHLDIISRASGIFEHLRILVLINTNKKPLFEIKEREDIIKNIIKNANAKGNLKNVSVDSFSGLTADYCKNNNFRILLRGLRNGQDLEYEKPISIINQKLYPDLETLFMPSKTDFDFISSSIIKEMGAHQREELELLVPTEFIGPLYKKIQSQKRL